MIKISKSKPPKGTWLYYFDLEMYAIIIVSYIFGYIGGFVKSWILPISLIFLGIPFYLFYRYKRGIE